MELSTETIHELINEALLARKNAYTPYSKFSVGAALLTNSGEIITGCNVENAAYSPSNCAERTAVFKAVSEGKRNFTAIAIAAGSENENPKSYTSPCGVCRQVLREFVDPSCFKVIMARSTEDYVINNLEDLLPFSFGPDNLK